MPYASEATWRSEDFRMTEYNDAEHGGDLDDKKLIPYKI